VEFETEAFFICPYCGQQISMLLEGLYGKQSYIEDCETCCNPIEITFNIEDGELLDLRAERAQ